MNFWFRLPLRTRLGIVSCVVLTYLVVLLLLWYYDPARFAPYRSGGMLRFGSLFLLLCLAWSDLEKIPWWNWLIILVTIIFCAIKPPAWFIGVPIIGYILFAGWKKK